MSKTSNAKKVQDTTSKFLSSVTLEPQIVKEPQKESHDPAANKTTAGKYTKLIEKEEPRSKRHPLMLQPSFYAKLKTKCDIKEVSMNELINTILMDHIDEY